MTGFVIGSWSSGGLGRGGVGWRVASHACQGSVLCREEACLPALPGLAPPLTMLTMVPATNSREMAKKGMHTSFVNCLPHQAGLPWPSFQLSETNPSVCKRYVYVCVLRVYSRYMKALCAYSRLVNDPLRLRPSNDTSA